MTLPGNFSDETLNPGLRIQGLIHHKVGGTVSSFASARIQPQNYGATG
jgi:hypothetical protein